MKILFLSSYLPYPLHSGGHIRLYNILKHLSKNHEITLVCEKRSHQTEQDINEVKKTCKEVLTVDRGKQWDYKNVLQTGFSTDPFLIIGHTHESMREILEQQLLKKSFDLIHVETSYVLQNLPETSLPIVLTEHNIEYLVYKRYASTAPLLLRPFLYFDVFKLKTVEQKFWERATRVITVSDDEKEYIHVPHVTVVPNGVDVGKFRPKNLSTEFDKKERKILFIGDFKWMQNRDTLRWILQDIWPRITKKLRAQDLKATVTLWVVGRNIPENLKKVGEKNDSIFFDENNTMETEEIFSNASILLTPTRVGGGTSYKILESMAVGTPVITSSLGAEGLEVKNNHDLLIGNGPEEIADLAVKLLSTDKLYKELAYNGRESIIKYYTWEMVVNKLEDTYKEAIKEQ